MPSRGQTAFEYLLLLVGISMAVILVIVLARSFLTGPSGAGLLNQEAGGFFNLIANVQVQFGSQCSLTASPSSLASSGGVSTITVTYTALSPTNNNVTVTCGNGNTTTATGCSAVSNASTATCSANCTYAAGAATYTVTASITGVTCTATTVSVGTGGATPTPTPTPTPSGSPGWPASNNTNFTLYSPAFSGLNAQASNANFTLSQAFVALQPTGVASNSNFTLSAGPAYSRS